jgi:hypothetical protein
VRQAREILAWATAGAFALALLLGVLMPLYTDDVGSRMITTRAIIEGGRLVSLLPQCEGSFITPLPASQWPGALVYHVLFSWFGLAGIKLSALVLVVLVLGGVWVALKRRIGPFSAFLSVQAVGLLPLALISGRAETVLLVVIAALVALPLRWPFARVRSIRRRVLLALAYVVMLSTFFFAHPKSLLFLPLVLLSILASCGTRRWVTGVVLCGAALFMASQTFALAKTATACAEAPHIEHIFAQMTFKPAELLASPGLAVENYALQASRSGDAMSFDAKGPRWLMPAEAPASLPVSVVDAVVRFGIGAFFFLVPLYVVVAAFRAPRVHRKRTFLALVIVACTAGHVALSRSFAFYNVTFVTSLFALAAIVAPPIPIRNVVHTGRMMLNGFAILSVIVLLVRAGPIVWKTFRYPGTDLPDRPSWVPPFGYSVERPKIRAMAASCGIRGDGMQRLVIDDATFFAFDDLHEPLHLSYVNDGDMWGADVPGDKAIERLRHLRASGIISRCPFLPRELVSNARRDGDYCCVPPGELR